MKTLITSSVRVATVKLIGRLLQPIAEAGVISIPELNNIMSNLRYLAQKGTLRPIENPKLLNPKEVAEMLGISYSHFRNLEQDGHFPFKRRMVGTAVRYFNTDILDYILSLDEDEKSDIPHQVG